MATSGLYGNSPNGTLIAESGTESTGLYGKSPNGSVVAAPGSDTSGLYGNAAATGGTYFEWFVFQVSASQPATPTGGSWDFTTNVGTPPSGWSNAPASAPTNPVWISIGLVNSRSTVSIVWSTPGVFSYSGQLNGSAAPTSGIGIDGTFYIQTGVSPYAIWYKNSGTWVQVTGAALYVALTGDQTIAGTKTFSSLIQGSISGNAATATSATTAATATYATTAGSATTASTATYATSAGSVPYSGLTGTVPTWNQNTTGNAATATYATSAGTATTAGSATVAGNVTGIVAIANGGTGASTAATARTNLGLGTSAVLNAGVALGVATLDAGGTVPLSQIPASLQGALNYQGTWNASSNVPTLTSSVGTKGYYYVVNVAGTTNLNGITDWQIGDWAIYNGTAWQKIDNTDAVTSVNGYTGTVVLNANDVGALSNITSTDGSVTVTTPSTGVRDLSVAVSASTTNVICQVRNTTGATLTKGTVVYISGGTGQIPTVSKALATSDATSAQTLGMMTADLANNTNGYVTVIGLITNIDTSAYTDGQQLYLSGTTAGAVTGTKTYAPTHLVYVAVVEYAHPTQGKLFVKVQNGYELDEIHNVSARTPTTGQTIVYNSSTSLWEQSNAPVISGTTIDNTVIGGTTPATGTFTTLRFNTSLSVNGSNGTNGQVLTSSGAGLPTWSTPTTGTVTSVSGTGTVSGISLSGTVTSSGNLTLGGTLDLSSPPAIGATSPSTGKFTTLTSTGTATLGNASTTYVQAIGDASYPGVYAAGGTNTPLVLQPLGTGALQAQKTDSTATGGNARGANAVDWQTGRASAGNVASGQYSVVSGGFNNAAVTYGAIVGGGQSNTANSGSFPSISGGISNTASGSYAFIGNGQSNISAGYYNLIGGGFTNSGTSGSAVTTQSGTMNGTTAVTLSGSNGSIKVGQYITGTSIANDTYVAAISGTSLTLSKNASGSSTSTLSFYTPHGVVVGGGNNQATGSYSFIGGGGDAGTAANRNVASGDWSFVGGGQKNVASGYGSVVAGGGTYGAPVGNTASGIGSFVGSGWGNQATNTASSVITGAYSLATGQYSAVVGGQIGTTRSINGSIAFPSSNAGGSNITGGSQGAILVLGRQTTDATATVLTSDTSAASTINQVILPNNSAYYFRGTVVAGVTGGGNTKGWTVEGVIKRGANAASTTVVGVTVASMYADAGAVTWTIGATADTTNGGLAITFTGQAATTIRCVAKIETTEMTY